MFLPFFFFLWQRRNMSFSPSDKKRTKRNRERTVRSFVRAGNFSCRLPYKKSKQSIPIQVFVLFFAFGSMYF